MTEVEFVASISALLHQQSTESSLGSIDDEQMTTDVDLLVVTENSEVVVSLSNPILHLALNVEISDFVLRVAVSFIEKPAPAGDAVYEPNGAASTLNDSSQDTERSCGAPLLVANKVLIPFVDDQSMLDMESLVANHSCGVLLIRGLQDLFATLECSEILQSRKQVDSAWIRLDHLKPRVGCAEHASFGCVGDRRAEFEVSWYPFARPRGSQQEEEAPLPDDVARTGVVFMKLLRCERLASMDVNRTLDPYVVFSVGCRTKQSTVKRHTFNPIWDPPESFELLVADYQHDEMSVLVMDSNLLKTDDTVSRVQIGLEPVQRTHRLTDIWLLEGNCGSVTLEPGWRGC
ncbi:C2 domain [Phytophthora cactorum]|nr:C2 domain [Phytophthora cactorum]